MNLCKALLIVPHYACKDTTGGGQRTQLLLASLISKPEISSIDILVLDELGRSGEEFFDSNVKIRSIKTAKLRERGQVGIWGAFRGIKPKLFDFLAITFGRRSIGYSNRMLAEDVPFRLDDYRIVIGRYLRPMAMSGYLQSRSTVSFFLDVDDRDDILYSSRMNSPDLSILKRIILRWHHYQVTNIQKKLLPIFSHCWLANENDQKVLPTNAESVLPNIPYTLKNSPSDQGKVTSTNRVLLFVGAFGHRINREGVEWFLNRCWDDLLREIPDAEFRVVGSGGWDTLSSKYKDKPGVSIVGFCEDLEKEYKQAALTVVPLFEGGGTKIKVLESILFGRVAFGTKHAYSGYQGLANICKDAITASAESFCADLVNIMRHPDNLNEIAKPARQHVLAQYGFTKFQDRVHQGLDRVLKNV